MTMGSDAGPVMLWVTQGSTGKKIKVRLGFRPIAIMYWVVTISSGSTKPGVIFDNDNLLTLPDSASAAASSELDSTASKKNLYVTSSPYEITDYGFKTSGSSTGPATTSTLFACFKADTPSGLYDPLGVSSINSGKFGSGNLFSRGEDDEEQGVRLDVYAIT